MSTKTEGELATLSTPAGFPTLPPGTFSVEVQAVTANITYTEDGTTPTATNGKVLIAGHDPSSIAGNLANVLFYDAGGTATLRYTLFTDQTMA